MFRPLPMKHVRLLTLTEDLPQASLTLAETESFHPDTRDPAEAGLPNQPGREYRDTYLQARSRLSKISKLILGEEVPKNARVRVIDHTELQQIDNWLAEIWNETSRYEEALRRLDDQQHFVKEQEASLHNFANLNIDLGLLRSKTRFLDFYVGIVPRENLRQLEGAVELADHILHTYMRSGDNAHVVIVGPTGEKESQLSSVLSAVGFQYLPIPQELDKAPDELSADLAKERESIEQERNDLRQRIKQWSETFSERLAKARSSLLLAEPFVALDSSIRSAGHLAVLAGWVPKHEVSQLEQRLRESLAFSFDLEARDPLPEERTLVPSVPVQSRLLQPFSMLVKQFALAHHGLVNLVFYLSLVWGGLNLARTGRFGMLPMLLVITALGALAWYGWRQMEAPVSEKILVVFIETLEIVIGYISNTLSFLRVAAFSLNHVALSIAVFTLADMMGAFGHVMTVILGNLFVLVLEGGIVMIQVMRLEFYEGFARYFSGDGHEFAPLRLRRGGAAGHNTEA